ncbi:MAG: anthranilate synthase component I [Dehalococcoidia bacterium]|nr:MAG: anthranilate synthase component I [Dehalococcoidia bacterium]
MAVEYSPSLEKFRGLAKEGNLVPVYRELSADLDTPVSVFLKLGQEAPTFLLESVEGGEKLGRFSFMGIGHNIVLKSSGDRAIVHRNGERQRLDLNGRDCLHVVQELLAQRQVVTIPGLPRFFGGAVGYMSYDTVRHFEKLPKCSRDELGLPECVFVFTDTMIIFDHVQHKMKIVANTFIDGPADIAYEQATSKIDAIVARLARPLAPESIPTSTTATVPQDKELKSNFTQAEFEKAVITCKEYISAGDAFQIVPSQRLQRKTNAKPFAIYRALRMLNPSPYLFYLDFGDFQLIGSSPEMLVKVEDGLAETCPIAGTRPRGATEEEDNTLTAELLNDPKELAEHAMLVDLARNDLGRVCQYGTVRVPVSMIVEKYSHVMHIVSTVEGKLREDENAFSLLRASFPAGTLTGAPKIRAMEIITEIEDLKRGPYGGAVGYFSFTGNMDTCITIRTIVMIRDTVYLQAGAGIVYDSDPTREYQETLNKIKALESAIQIAEEENSSHLAPSTTDRGLR